MLLQSNGRENESVSFAQVLKNSLSVEKTIKAFCDNCKKFSPTNQYARVSKKKMFGLSIRWCANAFPYFMSGGRSSTNSLHKLRTDPWKRLDIFETSNESNIYNTDDHSR